MRLYSYLLSVCFLVLMTFPAFAGDYKNHLGLFNGSDWQGANKEFQQQNQRDYKAQQQQMRDEKKAPFEMGQATEVTIQLKKQMPSSQQGSADRPFLGPDKSELDSFEEDPFAKEKVDIPELKDPLEGVNRSIYSFNDAVYENLLRPVADVYRDILHEEVRIAIRNLFNNALAPIKLVSSVVQLDAEKSGRVLARTLINTAFGVGGMLDVAGQEYGIKDVNEDFNQALGYHGVGSGPYVVLPFLGPSTARGVVGKVVDSFLSPTIFAAPGFAVGAAMSGGRIINDSSFHIEDIDQLKRDAIDPYESMRDFYHQYTEGQIQK